jgi:hypothetical protein
MAEIIRLFIIVLCVYITFRAVMFIAKRTMMLIRIYSLKKECNAKISLQRFPYRPMWLTNEKPDIKVEILDTVYLIRIYSGGGISRSIHFANECYSASYISTVGGTPRRRGGRAASPNPLTSGLNIGAKVIYTKPLNTGTDDPRKKIVPVLMLNPAPGNLSYVTEEKTSIRIAFTGDEMYGMKVFTASTFAIYADRMKREELRLREENALSGYAKFDYFNSF